MTIALEYRLTHGYVGTYKHLDKWMHLGTIDEIGSRDITPEDEEDMCDPKVHELHILISLDNDSADLAEMWIKAEEYSPELGAFEKWRDGIISRAISDVYSSHGCAHEYDCCGCRSYHARDVKRIAHGESDLYRVEISSSRNY